MLLNIDFMAIDSGPPIPLPVFNDFTSTLAADATVPSSLTTRFDIVLEDKDLNPYEGRAADTDITGTKMITVGYSGMVDETYIKPMAIGLSSNIAVEQGNFTIAGMAGITSVAFNGTSSLFFFAAPNQVNGRIGVGVTDSMSVSYLDTSAGQNAAQYVARSPDYQVLVSAGENGISFIDIRNGAIDVLQTQTYATRGRVTQIAVSQNGDRVVVGYAGGMFVVYSRNINVWDSGVVMTVPNPDPYSYLSVSINANGTTFLIGQPNGDGSGDGHVYVYDTHADRTTPTLTHTFNGEDVKKIGTPSWTGDRYQFGAAVLVSKEQKSILMADTMEGELHNFTRASDAQYSPGSSAPTHVVSKAIADFIYYTLPNVHYALGGQYLIWAHEATGIKVLKTS